MGGSKIFFGIIKIYLFSIIVIILAAALRLWPLLSLGGRTVWITFYPAVMVVVFCMSHEKRTLLNDIPVFSRLLEINPAFITR